MNSNFEIGAQAPPAVSWHFPSAGTIPITARVPWTTLWRCWMIRARFIPGLAGRDHGSTTRTLVVEKMDTGIHEKLHMIQ